MRGGIALSLTSALALAACGSDGNGAADAAGGGDTAQLSFAATNGVRNSGALVDPLVGTVYGQIFLASQVTLSGPMTGATEFGSVEVLGVDLVTAQSAGSWTSAPLAPETYTFLGFFDVDGNGATTINPDNGDPVTLPRTDDFVIVAGQPVTLIADFDLVYNF